MIKRVIIFYSFPVIGFLLFFKYKNINVLFYAPTTHFYCKYFYKSRHNNTFNQNYITSLFSTLSL